MRSLCWRTTTKAIVNLIRGAATAGLCAPALAQTGACCFPGGTCTDLTSSQCTTQGGTYKGDGTTCGTSSCPVVLTPFVDPLPLPAVAQPVIGQPGGQAHYVISMTEFNQQLHRDLPPTRVWGYNGTYPGPTIEARRGLPVTVQWINDLRDTTGALRTTHYLPVDTCLHGPDVNGTMPMTVVHLHGGHVPSGFDGQPELAFRPGQSSPVYTYPNDQPAATLWYHDHGLGLTRLNVYMGLAAYYLLRDAAEDALNLPRGEFEVPLAIQDRSFNPDGSLRYFSMWMDHFYGDSLLVNGKVWPYFHVKKGKYRFRLLNGCNSRALTLALSDGATFWQIGSDQGLLAAPVPMTSLTLTNGERADVIVDFASYASGTEIVLTNSAPSPFPGSPGVGVIPNVMKFIVGAAAGDADPVPATLVPVPRIPESEAILQRDFNLRLMPSHLCGHTLVWGINDRMWSDISERPVLDTTEIWAWVNQSGMAHPMHMHQVMFQVLDRQNFTMVNGQPVPTGSRIPPDANELGWKDTVHATARQITRVIVRFRDFPGVYPYHCHVLEHEDNEMMRQMEITCPPIQVTTQPVDAQPCHAGNATFHVVATGASLHYQWRKDGMPLADGPRPSGAMLAGAAAPTLTLTGVSTTDAGRYSCTVSDPCGQTRAYDARLFYCPGDYDDGTGGGACDGGVTIDDLLYYLPIFYEGDTRADVDDGNGQGFRDGGVTIDDLLYYLTRFDLGC